jgi:hypothetical protein
MILAVGFNVVPAYVDIYKVEQDYKAQFALKTIHRVLSKCTKLVINANKKKLTADELLLIQVAYTNGVSIFLMGDNDEKRFKNIKLKKVNSWLEAGQESHTQGGVTT